MNDTSLIALVEHTRTRLQTALDQQALSLGHGTNTALDEAAWLVLWAAGLPLDTELDERDLDATQTAQVQRLLARRLDTRKPLAYLTQEAWLHGIPFYVDERVIIPRSLIAEPLLDGSLDPWLSEHTQRVLDLCTGNGSVAVLAAMVYPEVVVDAADISADALAVARINTDKHHMSERVHLLHSDGLSALNGPYDLILCNPPYVNSQSMASLPTEYRQEPTISLAGGADGMDFIRPMLAALPRVLSEHGVLVLEIGHERPHFESAFPHLNPVWLATSAGDDHVLLLTKDML
jgi:ribosomal protein L3 glutamine methyltransferase